MATFEEDMEDREDFGVADDEEDDEESDDDWE